MFTLAQLTGFVAVAEELHFGRAAERLHLTQPPLTRQIQALERELGVDLFDRLGRGIPPTPSGRSFPRDARPPPHVGGNGGLTVPSEPSRRARRTAGGVTR